MIEKNPNSYQVASDLNGNCKIIPVKTSEVKKPHSMKT